MSKTRQAPVFRDLSQDECIALLERNSVGHLAFSFHDRIDIQPLHYAYEAGWVYGRTSVGAKLETLAHHQWVAFEVDELRGVFDWASVVVKGSFQVVDAKGNRREKATNARALERLRELVPDALEPGDPVPFRSVMFRINAAEMTGRSASPR